MAARRPTQFGLFGGEEEVEERTPVADGGPVRADEDPVFPPGAFPADPWEALRARTVEELEQARELASPDAVRRALCRYFKRGLTASWDHGELVDLLCVSNDLLAEAGFPTAEADRVLSEVLPAISAREIQSTPLE
jgi:hypothetical protein